MKIRLTDNRGVWLDGAQRHEGYEATLDDAAAQALIDAGLAKQVHTRAKRSKADDADTE